MAESVTASEIILESPSGKQARIRLGDDGFIYKEDMNGDNSSAYNVLRDQQEPDD
jgi:hypothetical protein